MLSECDFHNNVLHRTIYLASPPSIHVYLLTFLPVDVMDVWTFLCTAVFVVLTFSSVDVLVIDIMVC